MNTFETNFNELKNEISDYLNSGKEPTLSEIELFEDIKNELTLADARKKGFDKYKGLKNYTGIYLFVHKKTNEKIYIGEAGSRVKDSLMERLNAQTTKGEWNNSTLLISMNISLENLHENYNVIVFKIAQMDKKEYKYLSKALESYFIGYYEPIYNNTVKESFKNKDY